MTPAPLSMTAHDPGCKRPILLPEGIKPWAEFGGTNDCYRYKLLHRWSDGPLVMFAMKNPSAADLRWTDATVAKCGRLAKRWGYGGLMVANACAYRATVANDLLAVPDPVGPRNLEAIREMASEVSQVVIAHGSLPGKKLQIHADAMCNTLQAAGHSLYILRLSKHGNTPQHPLYIPETIKPSLWKRN